MLRLEVHNYPLHVSYFNKGMKGSRDTQNSC